MRVIVPVLALVGAILGFVGAVLTTLLTAPAADCLADETASERIAALEADLAALAPEDGADRALDWPADPDPRYTRDGVRASLQAALAHAGSGEVHALQCGEYPCITTLTMPAGQDPHRWRVAVHEALEERGYALLPRGRMVLPEDDIAGAYTFSLYDGPLDDAVRARIKRRVNEQSAQAISDLRVVYE